MTAGVTRCRHLAGLVLAVYLALYLLPLASRPLFLPDEFRYGEIPREMLASGDWLVPRLDGFSYFEKPPLGYWVNGGAMALLGRNPFALRLPSALAMGITALALGLLTGTTTPTGEKGNTEILAPLVLLTSLEAVAVGTFAVLDGLLTCLITLTVTGLFFAARAPAGSGKARWLAAVAGVAAGLAFLTKGFLALVMPALAVGPWLVWEGRPRDLWRLGWPCFAGALLTATPWSVAIALRAPAFWPFFVINEHLRRFLAGNAQHAQSFWFFFATAPAMFLPWSAAAPAILTTLRLAAKEQGTRAGLARLAVTWFFFPFLFFSLSHGKLLTYILPCLPPFALLVTLGLTASRPQDFGWRWSGRLLLAGAGLGMAAALALVIIQVGGEKLIGFTPYAHGWKWLLAVNGLAILAFCLWRAARSRTAAARILATGLAPVLLLGFLPGLMPDLTLEKKAPGDLLTRHRGAVTADTVLVADEEAVNAAAWTYGRADVFLLGGAGELAFGAGLDPGGRDRILDLKALRQRISATPGRVILVARARNYRRWRQDLPPPRRLDTNGPAGYVLVQW